MQLKNQKGQQRNWKVVAAVTAASAIGLSGLALANPGDGASKPDSIQLRDRTEIAKLTSNVTAPGTFQILMSATDTGNDSPFGDVLETGSPSDSPSPDSPSPDSDSVSASFDSSVDS